MFYWHPGESAACLTWLWGRWEHTRYTSFYVLSIGKSPGLKQDQLHQHQEVQGACAEEEEEEPVPQNPKVTPVVTCFLS